MRNLKLLLVGAALLCSTGWAQAVEVRSEYTSLDAGCKVLWRAADQYPLPPLPDSFKSICPGRDGMRVVLEGGDARSWIGLIPPGAKYDRGTRLHTG
jgi:hypothetical protein